jgi:DNA-binding GntR family transcriptional regulator
LQDFTTKDINDLYDLREALETHVVRSIHLSPELLAELNQSVQRMRRYLQDNDKAHYIDEDMRFHAILVTATQNERLSKTLQNVQNLIWIFRRKTYDLSSSTAQDFHEAIVKALNQGNREQAEATMRAHISTVQHKLIEFLAQQPASAVPPVNAGAKAEHSPNALSLALDR